MRRRGGAYRWGGLKVSPDGTSVAIRKWLGACEGDRDGSGVVRAVRRLRTGRTDRRDPAQDRFVKAGIEQCDPLGRPKEASLGWGDEPLQPSGLRTVRATVVQAASAAFDREACLDRVADLTGGAAADGAELVVFPEAFVGGYPKRADFGARVGSRSAEGREWFRRYHDGAMDVPGPAVDRLGEIARAAGSTSSWG